MRVFVTGASGFIGTTLVKELVKEGHHVIGLARSPQSAERLRRVGAEPHAGTLTDLTSLRSGAEKTDGVVHLAYMHALSQIPLRQRLGLFVGGRPSGIVSRFVRITTQADRAAIDALGETLRDSARPLVTAFGTLGLAAPGKHWRAPANERDAPDPRSPGFGRAQVEQTVATWAERGVRTSIIRLPPTVHGYGRAGFVSELIRIARKRNLSAYPVDGANRWPAVHVEDAARLFRLALESGQAGTTYHGVAEEGIALKGIAETIAHALHLPCQSLPTESRGGHFGWLGAFVGLDNPAEAALTRAALDWGPTQVGLLADLEQGTLFS